MRSVYDALYVCIFLLVTPATQLAHAEPARTPLNVIVDTDMWSDIDDMLALAMLHALHDRHEINLVAITVSTDQKWCIPYIDLIDTFYGHPSIPIGMVRDGKNPVTSWADFTRLVAQRRNANGAVVYPHRLTSGEKAPESVSLLRKTLAAQLDGSVVMIQVGYSTNFARLLDSRADSISPLSGAALVKRKVRLLSIMAGNFSTAALGEKSKSNSTPEWNLMVDVPAAQKLFSSWPTAIVASGSELGTALLYPGESITNDYTYVENHPIAETYRLFCEASKAEQNWACPHSHPTYDLTSVLYAARPHRDYFSLSKPGKITVLADGASRFDESESGTHHYLIVNEQQKARTLEAMVMLSSQPPVHAHGH